MPIVFPVLRCHKFIGKSNRAVKSTSDFADGDKIKGTLRSIKDKSEVEKGEDMPNQCL